MKENDNFKNIIKKLFPYILMLLATLFICIPLFKNNENIFLDDGVQHICRLMGTYQSILEKQIFPVIMSNFCNGFGYSWNLFYSPLTAFFPLIFKVFGLSYTNCIKIFMLIVIFLSGIAMYKYTNKITKNKNIALLSAILYIFSPYRITDMYIRNSLAELTSFTFIPIIFNGIYIILNEHKKSYLLAIGIIGLMLTHTVITMYMAILCLIYLICNIKELKNKKVFKILLLNLFFAIIITSFYWVPLLQHKYATNYEVFVPGRMERTEVLNYYKVSFYELFYTTKNQTMIYSIGIITVIGLLLTTIMFKKIPKEYKKIYIIFFIMGIVLTLMTTTFFPFEKLPSILKMIQFTFRLLEFTSFFFAIIASINYGIVIKNFKLLDVIIISIIVGLLLIPYNKRVDYKENDEERLWPAINITSNTGRVHAGMATMEYLPSKAFNNKEYIINRSKEPIVLIGQVNFSNFEKDGTNMSVKISNGKKNTVIELPYIFYLGYNVKIDNGYNTENIKYTESDNGFIQIELKDDIENAIIKVDYSGTIEMKVSAVTSIIGFIVLIWWNFCKD